MEDSVTWPVQPAPVEEKSLGVGAISPSRDLLSALVERLDRMIQALDNQNRMLLAMVDMNQQILEELVGRDEEEVPTRDLAGRPLKL